MDDRENGACSINNCPIDSCPGSGIVEMLCSFDLDDVDVEIRNADDNGKSCVDDDENSMEPGCQLIPCALQPDVDPQMAVSSLEAKLCLQDQFDMYSSDDVTFPVPYHLLTDQWKFAAPYINLENSPSFVTEFLNGKLITHHVQPRKLLRFLVQASNPSNSTGVVLTSLFILELFTNTTSIRLLLEFYRGADSRRLDPKLRKLIKSITLQKLQQFVHLVPEDHELPLLFRSKLDRNVALAHCSGSIVGGGGGGGGGRGGGRGGGGRGRGRGVTYSQLDVDLLRQVERVLLEIVSRLDNYGKSSALDDISSQAFPPQDITTAFGDDVEKGEEKARDFCVQLVKSVISSMLEDSFGSIYEVMLRTCIERNCGSAVVYMYAQNDFGIFPVQLFPYNATFHGIPPLPPLVLQTVRVSSSGKELQVFHDLVHSCSKPGESYVGRINLAIYEMAKAVVRGGDIGSLLFRDVSIHLFLTPCCCRDVFSICVKERIERLFEFPDLLRASFLQFERRDLLNWLSTEEVIWVLGRRHVPFINEMEVYHALVNWAVCCSGKAMMMPLVKGSGVSHGGVDESVLHHFRSIFPSTLCLLDLSEDFGSLLDDGFILPEILQEALDYVNAKTSGILLHSAIRRRVDIEKGSIAKRNH